MPEKIEGWEDIPVEAFEWCHEDVSDEYAFGFHKGAEEAQSKFDDHFE